MRLYTLQDASSVQHEHHGSFDVDPETGGVEVPHELGEHLHATHIHGKPAWETEAERHARLVNAEIERRRDPASMYELMQQVAAKPVEDDTVARLEAEIADLRAKLTAAPAKKAPAKKAPAKKAAATPSE